MPTHIPITEAKEAHLNPYRSLIITLAAALMATVLGITPASAVTDVNASMSKSSMTIGPNDCKTTKVTVTGDWESDYSTEIDVVVYGPNWGVFNDYYTYDDFDGQVIEPIEVCGWDPRGTYHVDATVYSYNEDGDLVSQATDSTKFQVQRPEKANSRIKRRVRDADQPDGDYAVPGQLLRNGHGYKRRWVTAQVRMSGYWYDADTMRTRRRGLFGWYFDANRYTWRYKFDGNSTTKPSKSNTFQLPRSGARVAARTGEVDPSTLIHRR